MGIRFFTIFLKGYKMKNIYIEKLIKCTKNYKVNK